MTIKQQGGIFGRNPTFNDVETKSLVTDTADINGGTIDATVIGGSTPASISGTSGQFGTSLNVDGTITSDGLTVEGGSGSSIKNISSITQANIRLGSTYTTGTGGANKDWSILQSQAAYGDLAFRQGNAEGDDPRTSGVTRFYLNNNGNVTVSTGNLVIGTSGKGIDFSATSGTGTSELFDDYEEGTWTPVLTGSTSGTLNGEGRYVKVGSLVTIFCSIRNITTANKPSGNYSITGLPFTSISGTNPDTTPLSVDMSRITFDASKVFNAMILFDSTTISLQELTSNNSPSAITDANFVNGSNMYLRISGTYTV